MKAFQTPGHRPRVHGRVRQTVIEPPPNDKPYEEIIDLPVAPQGLRGTADWCWGISAYNHLLPGVGVLREGAVRSLIDLIMAWETLGIPRSGVLYEEIGEFAIYEDTEKEHPFIPRSYHVIVAGEFIFSDQPQNCSLAGAILPHRAGFRLQNTYFWSPWKGLDPRVLPPIT